MRSSSISTALSSSALCRAPGAAGPPDRPAVGGRGAAGARRPPTPAPPPRLFSPRRPALPRRRPPQRLPARPAPPLLVHHPAQQRQVRLLAVVDPHPAGEL